MKIEPGDILLTRNAGGEEANQSPGYYNHSAIISVNDWVIEAQQTPDSVIAVPIWCFFARYPEILVLRNDNETVAQRTAEIAPMFLGRRYAIGMSVRPLWLWKDKDSCISLLRRIYNQIVSHDYKWRIPDSLLDVSWLRHVALKKDYENFKPPADIYQGMVKEWPNDSAKNYL